MYACPFSRDYLLWWPHPPPWHTKIASRHFTIVRSFPQNLHATAMQSHTRASYQTQSIGSNLCANLHPPFATSTFSRKPLRKSRCSVSARSVSIKASSRFVNSTKACQASFVRYSQTSNQHGCQVADSVREIRQGSHILDSLQPTFLNHNSFQSKQILIWEQLF